MFCFFFLLIDFFLGLKFYCEALSNSRFASTKGVQQASWFCYNGISEATHKSYHYKYNPFIRWGQSVGVPNSLDKPLTQEDVTLYCSHRANKVQLSTIRGDLSALRDLHVKNGWYWPSPTTRKNEWPLLTRTLKGIQKVQGKQYRDGRKAIYLDTLKQMYRKVNFCNTYQRTLFTIMTLLFFGLLRVSELCNNVPIKIIRFKHCLFLPNFTNPEIIKIYLPITKSSQVAGESVIFGKTDRDLCPVTLLKELICHRMHAFNVNLNSNSPVFVNNNTTFGCT